MRQYSSIPALSLLVASIIWGTAYLPSRYAGENGIGVFFELSITYGFPLFILFIFFFKQLYTTTLTTKIHCMAIGILLWLALVATIYGLRTIQFGSIGLLLLSLSVVFIPLARFLFYRVSIPYPIIASVILTISGISLLAVGSPVGTPNIGTLLCFIASILYTAHFLLCQAILDKSIPAQALHFYQNIPVAILSIIAFYYIDFPNMLTINLMKPDIIAVILFWGCISGFLGYQLIFYGQQHLDPVITSIILSTSTFFGALADKILFNSPLTTLHYIAYAIILLSSTSVSIYSAKNT